jgi:hypothetical protein
MKDVLKIFLGKADTPELKVMGKKYKKLGFTTAYGCLENKIQRKLHNPIGKIVILFGGETGQCIPGAIMMANGAKRIVVPLDKVRSGNPEPPNQTAVYEQRAAEIVQKLIRYSKTPIKDIPLIVTPTIVWKRAVRKYSLK